MTIEKMFDNINAEEYSVNIPWTNETKQQYKEQEREKNKQFDKDLIDALMNDYNFSEEVAKKIAIIAYEEGHSGG